MSPSTPLPPPGPLPEPGLCGRCRNARIVASRRSTFLACALATVDPAFPRYPQLPVLACRGFAAASPAGNETGMGELG